MYILRGAHKYLEREIYEIDEIVRKVREAIVPRKVVKG